MLSRPGLRCRSFDSLFTCAGHFQCNEVGDTLDIIGYVFSLAADQDLKLKVVLNMSGWIEYNLLGYTVSDGFRMFLNLVQINQIE